MSSRIMPVILAAAVSMAFGSPQGAEVRLTRFCD